MQQLFSLSCGTLALLLLELPHVELQLLALQDVPISSATLSRARRNAGQQPSTTELLLNVRVQCTSLLALLKLPLDIVALLCFLCGSSSNLRLLSLCIRKSHNQENISSEQGSDWTRDWIQSKGKGTLFKLGAKKHYWKNATIKTIVLQNIKVGIYKEQFKEFNGE